MSEEEFRVEFGERLRECRERCELTQVRLAKEIGAHVMSVHWWEVGAHLPNLKMFRRLMDVLEVSSKELLCK